MQEIKTLPQKKQRVPVYSDIPEGIAKFREQQTVRRGEIYYVVMTSPVVGSEQQANRPAVVVSNDVGNAYSPVVEVVYLTTRVFSSRMPTQVAIGSSPRPSTALCENVHTVSKRRLERYLGSVTEEELQEIDKAVLIGLGMPDENTTPTQTKEKGEEKNMQKITIKTQYGEMTFMLPDDKVAEIITHAMKYAAKAADDSIPVAEEKREASVTHANPVMEPLEGETPFVQLNQMFPDSHGHNSEDNSQSRPKRPPIGRSRYYRGFLLIRCEECGELRGFCARTPTDNCRCKHCGHETPLYDLRPAIIEHSCGGEYHYRTNVEDPAGFKFPCLGCGEMVTLEYDPRSDQYVTAK